MSKNPPEQEPSRAPKSPEIDFAAVAGKFLTAAVESKSIPLPTAMSALLSAGEPQKTPTVSRNHHPGLIGALALATGGCVLLFMIWNDPAPATAPIRHVSAVVAPAPAVLKTCSEQVTEEVRNTDGTVRSTKTTRSEKLCQSDPVPAVAPSPAAPGLPIAGFAAKVLFHLLF